MSPSTPFHNASIDRFPVSDLLISACCNTSPAAAEANLRNVCCPLLTLSQYTDLLGTHLRKQDLKLQASSMMNASRTARQPCRSTQGAAFSPAQAQLRRGAVSSSTCRSRRSLVVRAAGAYEALEPDVYCCLVSSSNVCTSVTCGSTQALSSSQHSQIFTTSILYWYLLMHAADVQRHGLYSILLLLLVLLLKRSTDGNVAYSAIAGPFSLLQESR